MPTPEAPAGRMDGSWLRRAVSVARWLFTPAALLFLAVAGYGARETIVAIVSQAQWAGLAAAVVLWLALHFVSPLFTAIILRSFGSQVRYRDALAIHVHRLPAKYLPGGVWHTVSRMVDLHRYGVTRAHLAALVVLENAVPVAIALILGSGFLAAAGHDGALAMLAFVAGLVFLCAAPFVLGHRRLLGVRYRFDRSYLSALAATTLFWLIAATAFAVYWSSFPHAQEQVALAGVYAAYLLGWACGFLAIFAPQGLGVFESVAGLLLRGSLPFGGIALLVAGFRVAVLAADAIAYATYACARQLRGGPRGAH